MPPTDSLPPNHYVNNGASGSRPALGRFPSMGRNVNPTADIAVGAPDREDGGFHPLGAFEKANLTKAEQNALAKLAKVLKDSLIIPIAKEGRA